jgi:hypothetical protein
MGNPYLIAKFIASMAGTTAFATFTFRGLCMASSRQTRIVKT